MNIDKRLYQVMGREIPLSKSTNDRLADIYDQIRRQKGGKEITMQTNKNTKLLQKNNINRTDRRFAAVIAAAAVMVICAGSALAYTLTHYDFVNAVWRTDDTEQAVHIVEDYIYTSGQSVELMGYTYTVEEYMLDDNGMGFVRYSVENPDGIPTMNDATNGGIYTGGDSEFWFEPDDNGITIGTAALRTVGGEGNEANVHTWVDGVVSDDTKLYFTGVFTFVDEVEGNTVEMGFSVYDEEWNCTSESILLDVSARMPSVEYGDSTGDVRAKLSPLGVIIYGPDFYGAYTLDQLVINDADGAYTVRDKEQKTEAWRTATIGPDGAERIIFRSMADADVDSIIVNGYVLTRELAQTVAFNPDASPKAEIVVYEPADRSELVLASSPEENPFHYRRTDGIEVFVLTNDTILGAAEEDIHDYVAFAHDCLTYDEFLANAREDYDEYYSSREFYANELYPASISAGCMTAQESIDMYLDLIEEYYPDAIDDVEYVVVSARGPAGECCEWTLRSNTDALWEAVIAADTGKVLKPRIVGLNGEVDAATGEWIDW